MSDRKLKDPGRSYASALTERMKIGRRFVRLKCLRLYRSFLRMAARTFIAPHATASTVKPIVADVTRRAFVKFMADDGWPIASHIAFSSLTSLFSFLIFVTALSGFLGSAETADEAANFLFDTWPQRIAEPLTREIHRVLTRPHGGLLGISALLSIFFASSGVEALRVGLNRAYNEKEKRSWWLLRLESIVFVLIGAFALTVFTTLLVLGPLSWQKAGAYAPALLAPLRLISVPLRFGLSTLTMLLALILVHKFLPNGRRSLLAIAPGVILTLVLWLAFGVIFGAYVAGFDASYSSTYAGLGSVVILLVFLNCLGAIFVYGAELNKILSERSGHELVSRGLTQNRQ